MHQRPPHDHRALPQELGWRVHRRYRRAHFPTKTGKYLDSKSDADRVANPVYCPAAKIVQTPTAEMFQAGQTAMQNILTTNPNSNWCSPMPPTAVTVLHRPSWTSSARARGSVIKDLSKIGGLQRGHVRPRRRRDQGRRRRARVCSVAQSPSAVATFLVRPSRIVQKILSGGDFPEITWDALTIVTAVNGELVYQAHAQPGCDQRHPDEALNGQASRGPGHRDGGRKMTEDYIVELKGHQQALRRHPCAEGCGPRS